MIYSYPVREECGKLLGTIRIGFSLEDRIYFDVTAMAGERITKVQLEVRRWINDNGSIETFIMVKMNQLFALNDLRGYSSLK